MRGELNAASTNLYKQQAGDATVDGPAKGALRLLLQITADHRHVHRLHSCFPAEREQPRRLFTFSSTTKAYSVIDSYQSH